MFSKDYYFILIWAANWTRRAHLHKRNFVFEIQILVEDVEVLIIDAEYMVLIRGYSNIF